LNVDDALTRLGRSSLEAMAATLAAFLPDGVEPGAVEIAGAGAPLLTGISMPAVAARAGYADGVGGGHLIALPVAAARALAHAAAGDRPAGGTEDELAEGELAEGELAALGEAVSRTMAAAAAATSRVLGTTVEAAPAETRRLDSLDDAFEAGAGAAHIVRASLTVLGHPCRLVQLVPAAFVARMTQTLDALDTEYHPGDAAPEAASARRLDDAMLGVGVRVWAELGRRRMPIGQLVDTPPGVVLELDRGADETVDLVVNGLPFATARLLITEGGEWAVRIEELHERPGAAEARSS
jgi:flagellar motor switch protein FliN/FliY